jgi:hypothetical protein
MVVALCQLTSHVSTQMQAPRARHLQHGRDSPEQYAAVLWGRPLPPTVVVGFPELECECKHSHGASTSDFREQGGEGTEKVAKYIGLCE